MEKYTTLKEHYKFTAEEEAMLQKLQVRMEGLSDKFIDEFYAYISDFKDTGKFLKTKEIIAQHKIETKEWFINLFCGEYDMSYFLSLHKIGKLHAKEGVPTHYVNSSFTFVRTFVLQNIEDSSKTNAELIKEVQAIEKIIDINLDVLSSSYREEELSDFLALSEVEQNILKGLKKFNSYSNFFLAGALALVAFFAVGLFIYDVYLLFFTNIGIEKGILTVLGSLLVLWAAIELIQEEINHLQGKGFALGAFIVLAMAALIRKVLIYSLSSEKSEELLTIGAVIVGLSVAYWLVGAKKKSQ